MMNLGAQIASKLTTTCLLVSMFTSISKLYHLYQNGRHAMDMAAKWIKKLKPNNLLVSNDVNASFAAEEYISRPTCWDRKSVV